MSPETAMLNSKEQSLRAGHQCLHVDHYRSPLTNARTPSPRAARDRPHLPLRRHRHFRLGRNRPNLDRCDCLQSNCDNQSFKSEIQCNDVGGLTYYRRGDSCPVNPIAFYSVRCDRTNAQLPQYCTLSLRFEMTAVLDRHLGRYQRLGSAASQSTPALACRTRCTTSPGRQAWPPGRAFERARQDRC